MQKIVSSIYSNTNTGTATHFPWGSPKSMCLPDYMAHSFRNYCTSESKLTQFYVFNTNHSSIFPLKKQCEGTALNINALAAEIA